VGGVVGGVVVGVLGACTGEVEPTSSAPGAPAVESTVAEHTRNSDDLLAGTLDAAEPGCSAAVAIEGEVVWAGAGGVADLDTGRLIDTSTTFDIASVSKQFTATAVLLLAQEGALTLDDPVARWVRDLPSWSEDVTIAHLMHHESGIADYVQPLIDDGIAITDRSTQQDALDAIAAQEELRYPPDERFEYSNSNYVLLAEIVREATQQELPDFARERIFDPLDLAMAFDPSGASPDNTDPSSARGYRYDQAGGEWAAAGSRWEQVGDGGVQTTPSELVRWADNYRTGRLGGDELGEAQLADPAQAGGGAEYGAGIVRLPNGELRHMGAWAGYGSDFWISEDRRTAGAVTCNGDRGGASDGVYLTEALRQEWLS
jgi:CubicO group peptidase (beta-lactamase class C family)